jgi:peptidoglycan hydrolase-like protein with peptidoglycan-binding domain
MVWVDPSPYPSFPLPAGHAYAMDDGTIYTHSGVQVEDRQPIEYIQGKVGVTRDGRFGPVTASAVGAFQRRHALTVDEQVGPRTWYALA